MLTISWNAGRNRIRSIKSTHFIRITVYTAHRKYAASPFSVLKGLIGSCSDYRATAPLRERTKPERIDNIRVPARLIENRGSDARVTFSEGVTNRFRRLLLRGLQNYHRGEAKFTGDMDTSHEA